MCQKDGPGGDECVMDPEREREGEREKGRRGGGRKTGHTADED